MNVEDLQNKQKDVENHFNELSQQKANIDTEMRRLEGEHRLYTNLITTIKQAVKTDASTIVAKEKKIKDGK